MNHHDQGFGGVVPHIRVHIRMHGVAVFLDSPDLVYSPRERGPFYEVPFFFGLENIKHGVKIMPKLTNKQSTRFVEEYLIDLNATRARREPKRWLPSVYAFSTTGEWAKKCLEIMLPHKGNIGAFGHRISKETEETIFAGMEWTIMHPIPTKVVVK